MTSIFPQSLLFDLYAARTFYGHLMVVPSKTIIRSTGITYC